MMTSRLSSSLVTTLAVMAAFASAAAPRDILGMLERDVAGKVTPFLAGRRGSYYMGGQSIASRKPLTTLWPVTENETIGFLHPYFRDGRARGYSITCDEVTGCGHDLKGWKFFTDTRVLNGTVNVGDRTYVNPAPRSIIWRPDRLTARYELEAGLVLQEVKFFTDDDVLLNIITLLPSAQAPPILNLSFSGVSYSSLRTVQHGDPAFADLPANTNISVDRLSVSSVDTAFPHASCGGPCGAVRVLEHGTAWAKPIDCSSTDLPKGVDCKAKKGRMMYDGMSVLVAASQAIAPTAGGKDEDRRATYEFSVTLSPGTPLVLGWVMGDDAAEARARIAKYMSSAAAEKALSARASAANEFLTSKVPQLSVTLQQSEGSGLGRRLLAAGAWDVHSDASCNNNEPHVGFFNNVTSLQQCQAACDADARCEQVQFQHTGNKWCALYATKTIPQNSSTSKWDCACKGACPAPTPPPTPYSPVPMMNRTVDYENGYYFGWAMYWLMTLESQQQPGVGLWFENMGHAQSAPSNFLGLHLHDTQYYLKMGAWVTPELHSRYTHGNILMWHQAFKSSWYQHSTYWQAKRARGLLPDNMGATWIASSMCDQLTDLVEGAWVIYSKAPNATFLADAYELFSGVLTPADGNITSQHQKLSWANGKGIVALLTLERIASALGHGEDAAAWRTVLETTAVPQFQRQWGRCGPKIGCVASINSYSSSLAPTEYFPDEKVAEMAEAFLLNNVTGHYPPNASYGAVLLAYPLNETNPQFVNQPWTAHTTYTYEAIDGLFRHDVKSAVKLATEHIRDMQRSYGWTVFPEAWSRDGGVWGDQWYNWGSCVSTNMVLERLVGVDYSVVEDVLTVRDFLPEDWAKAEVSVPLGGEQWVDVTVERVNATAKRITVQGNTFGKLALQPGLGSKHLVAATPGTNYTVEQSGERVAWHFEGRAARDATVLVTWA